MTTPNRGVVGGEFGLMADEATITGMVMAFTQAQTEAADSFRNVVGAQATLRAQWQSDVAAQRFFEAVNQWLAGFQKVQEGLNKLCHSMEQYSRLTTTTEDDSAMQAGNWATAPNHQFVSGNRVQWPPTPLDRHPAH